MAPSSDVPSDRPVPVEFPPGSVWLVGAGPGDPGLLTLLAVEGLRQADVIIYDALVDERVLALARADAVREFAGKRAGAPQPSQAEISERLVALAGEGYRVLRLKGGDPFVFGRGGDEALALAAAHVPFRVVPGITAGIGGLAYAGIPVTQRGINTAVTFVTGHMAGGDVPDLVDWEGLARSSPVIVIYMGLNRLQRIAARLMAGGRARDEAVAIVSRATGPGQRVIETTLQHAAADAETAALTPPAIIVVGQVARLHPLLAWANEVATTPPETGPGEEIDDESLD
ncbi:MAG: uroporphyrinogen-III C-methyltransferase [Alphaproteobacteria bacterium]